MQKIISYSKKDFKIRWYSGSGAGGQHRNKHQNCCEIVHIESGMSERGTENKSRVANQRVAFNRLAKRVVKWALMKFESEKEINNNVIRNYNAHRNEVHDKASGLKVPYNDLDKRFDDLVLSRCQAVKIDELTED